MQLAMFLADFGDLAESELFDLLLLLVIAKHTLIPQIKDVIGVDVELDLIELLEFYGLEQGGLEDFLRVEGLVRDQDNVHLLLEQSVKEDVVSPVGARTDQVEVIDHQQEVFISVFVEGL
jgi:hypothetical protein